MTLHEMKFTHPDVLRRTKCTEHARNRLHGALFDMRRGMSARRRNGECAERREESGKVWQRWAVATGKAENIG